MSAFIDGGSHDVIGVADAIQREVVDAIDAVNALAAAHLESGNMQNALTSKLQAVIGLVEQAAWAEARDKLVHDVLQKTNGCALSGAPDRKDWVTDCAAQAPVYAAIQDVLRLVEGR